MLNSVQKILYTYKYVYKYEMLSLKYVIYIILIVWEEQLDLKIILKDFIQWILFRIGNVT